MGRLHVREMRDPHEAEPETLRDIPLQTCSLELRPYLIVALECDRPLAGGLRIDLHDVDEVAIGRGRECAVERSRVDGRTRVVLRIPGRAMSALHAIVTRDGGHWLAADLHSTNGMFVNGRRATSRRLRSGDVLELGHTLLVFVTEPDGEEEAPPAERSSGLALPEGLDTLMPQLDREFRRLVRIATSPLPLLVLGETGTGKELVARAVHALSGRSGSLVAVNCAALPESLVEDQLFGHQRGAFSGAVRDHVGLVRAAHGGTLLLDEIGDLPLSAQGALLRVLQEGEVLPIGATQPVKVDVRVVAATHRDLAAMAQSGAFRTDLLARLEGAIVRIPALRERPGDLGLLVASLLRRVAGARAEKVTITRAAGLALAAYAWPANVRELEKALARAMALVDDTIDLQHLPPPIAEAIHRLDPEAGESQSGVPREPLRDVLVMHLRAQRGNVAAVARAMGRAPVQIYRWMRRFGLDASEFRNRTDRSPPA